VTKSTAYAYNFHGGVTSITYPSGRTVSYTYNAADQTTSASDVSNGITYDSTTLASSGGTAINHDYTNYSTSNTLRGNPTVVSRWLNTTSTWLTTTNYFDDLGNLYQTTDPGGHTYTLYYTDNFTDGVDHHTQAFLTHVVSPTTSNGIANFRFIGLSVRGDSAALREYLRVSPYQFPVLGLVSNEDAEQMGLLDGTPQTLLISPKGRVEKSWLGAFQGKSQDEIERYFGTTLPGFPKVPLVTRSNVLLLSATMSHNIVKLFSSFFRY
jgi:YD repeat-containing protein